MLIRNKIHQSAVVHPEAKIGKGVSIGPNTVIGEYVEVSDKSIMFGEEDELRVWATYLTDASEVGTSWYDDDRLLGAFALEEFQLQTIPGSTRITLKAVDVAYL